MKASDNTNTTPVHETAGGQDLIQAGLVAPGKRGRTGAMHQDSRNKGICSTCIYCGSCSLCANHSVPIHHCEEFSVQVGRVGEAQKDMTSVANLAARRGSGTDCGKYMGLCMNCLHRESCTFPRPEGGVWRCNEYE